MAVYRTGITAAPDYLGPLVGFEIEAYAHSSVTGCEDGEDEASSKSLRNTCNYLRRTTRLPFVVVRPEHEAITADDAPTSSPSNPIWAVKGDYSLDPCEGFEGFEVGIEVVTPPIEPEMACGWLEVLTETMFADDFMSAANTGLHVNASVPGLSRETGLIALVDPLKRSTPARRRDLFNDPLFSAVMAAISNDADGEDEVAEAFLDRMMWERGLHAMNPIPLMRGHGYVEFRHLDSNSLVRDLEGTIDIVHDLVDLLARPPMDAARARLAKAVAIVRRIRDLDASCRIPAAVAALDVEDLCDRHDREGELLNLVASICESEPVLARTFQWIAKARHLDSQPATRRAFLALSRLPLQAQHLIHAMETRRLAEKGMSSRVRLGSRLPIPTNAARRMPVA